ncbi:glycoside hydrolase family 3 protein [Pseudobutyrivibrio sp.]|uniref:glycoside hydrolase family 3 protein n=1 Tax=Pseudobutyrivibrio sp. TaxID=2014367 RepID=UPI001E0B080D|nr:glycoside hydrolase family 3 N-terminal domain-containing protein [Pseudobutyrivibrio sp.]MBE5910133.1 glycoside hydrolase family 3 protein [Pseudobutyrivibrio sp.]
MNFAMLKNAPFSLNDSQIEWVKTTIEKMSDEEKIGQIFCPISGDTEPEKIKAFVDEFHPGGVLYRPMPAKVIQNCHRSFQENSDIPMLLAANLESGGVGIASDGTYYSRPMGVAATGDSKNAYRLGYISGKEAKAVGCNWSFAPICDLDKNYLNPIMNVRTFGDNVNAVIECVKEQLKGLSDNEVAAAAKHFPGDGVDFRDQHLVASVNSLSVEEYDESYGKIWQEVVNTGILSVMVGHILQPAYSKYFNPELKDEEILPATLSKEILQGLLRGKLGFNGVIVTDATPMLGFTASMKRSESLPACIMAGCDMILFNKDIREDYQYIRDALSDGRLTKERLDEAVLRILGMKAAMNLPEKKADGIIVPGDEALSDVGCNQHKEWTKQCADEAVTLVKDTQKLLPISPDKYRKIRLYLIEDRVGGGFKDGDSEINRFKELLEKEGFEVSVYDYSKPDFYEMFESGVGYAKEKFDLAIYVACIDTASNQAVRRIDWLHLMAADAPWFVEEIPTMFISLANPYHLVDAPMVKTFINAYTPTKEVCEAVIEKIMGRSDFKGQNPIDPFCNIWGSRF